MDSGAFIAFVQELRAGAVSLPSDTLASLTAFAHDVHRKALTFPALEIDQHLVAIVRSASAGRAQEAEVEEQPAVSITSTITGGATSSVKTSDAPIASIKGASSAPTSSESSALSQQHISQFLSSMLWMAKYGEASNCLLRESCSSLLSTLCHLARNPLLRQCLLQDFHLMPFLCGHIADLLESSDLGRMDQQYGQGMGMGVLDEDAFADADTGTPRTGTKGDISGGARSRGHTITGEKRSDAGVISGYCVLLRDLCCSSFASAGSQSLSLSSSMFSITTEGSSSSSPSSSSSSPSPLPLERLLSLLVAHICRWNPAADVNDDGDDDDDDDDNDNEDAHDADDGYRRDSVVFHGHAGDGKDDEAEFVQRGDRRRNDSRDDKDEGSGSGRRRKQVKLAHTVLVLSVFGALVRGVPSCKPVVKTLPQVKEGAGRKGAGLVAM